MNHKGNVESVCWLATSKLNNLQNRRQGTCKKDNTSRFLLKTHVFYMHEVKKINAASMVLQAYI